MINLLFIPIFLLSMSSHVFSQAEEKQVQTRDLKRHQMVMQKIEQQNSYDILFLGDSITHLLDEPKHLNPQWLKNSGGNFKYISKELKGKTFLNAGISGEETPHLFSRLEDGLSKVQSEFTVIMIGTNDTRGPLSAEQVAANIKKSISLIQKSNSDTKILLYAIFPRGKSDQDANHLKNQAVNKILATFPDELKNVKFIDINKDLLKKKNKVSKEVFYDLLHPTLKGYKIWIKSIKFETISKSKVPKKTNHQTRAWTNDQGKKVQAKFVSSKNDEVTLKLRNGRTHTMKINKLIQDDQDYINSLNGTLEK